MDWRVAFLKPGRKAFFAICRFSTQSFLDPGGEDTTPEERQLITDWTHDAPTDCGGGSKTVG